MTKMKERNAQLKSALGAMATPARVKEVASIPVEDAKNRQGFKAYSLSDELRLISMLNTLKLEPQYYRSENDTMKELRDLVERIGMKDPYFVAQAIVYSRCMGEGMRSINHLAAALLAPFISGKEFAKRFYGPFDKKGRKGGCIFRPDDMAEIKDVYAALNGGSALTNSMKKGFANVIEALDTYQMAKYKDAVIDIANLSHPKSMLSEAEIEVMVNGEKVKMKTLDALMKGMTISADTWEVANSEAGQEVAAAVKAGKLTKEKAAEVLAEAKNDNWEALLKEGKLGILAALRNIRSMLQSPRKEVIDALCALVSDGERIRKGLIMPYQIDYAYEVVKTEFGSTANGRQVMVALQKGYEIAVPNLALALPGRTCVMMDCSGSMNTLCYSANSRNRIQTNAAEKAGLIAATIAKATNADVIRFGSSALYYSYDPNEGVFSLGRKIGNANMGDTSIGSAFELIRSRKAKYDRIILLSDNECNSGWNGSWVSTSYKNYVHDVCSAYVYAVDLAAYGTTPLKGDKVNYYYGYGFSMFEDIASKEFNPMQHIDKVRAVVI